MLCLPNLKKCHKTSCLVLLQVANAKYLDELGLYSYVYICLLCIFITKKMVPSSYFNSPLVLHEKYNSADMQSTHVAHLHAFYNKNRGLLSFAPHRRWAMITRWYFLPTYSIYSVIFLLTLSQN